MQQQTDVIEQLAFEQIRSISVKTDKAQAKRNIDAMKCVVEFGMTLEELRIARENNERAAQEIIEAIL